MTNMNTHKDPCVYGLVDPDGRVFYVGSTKVNALNRWWEHRYRARIGHPAPVYARWSEIGLDAVGFEVLESTPEENLREREAWWIKNLIDSGLDLVNQFARDGIPDSMSDATKGKLGAARRGKPTWIKGKKGIEAGWTDERRKAASDRQKERMKHGSRRLALDNGCQCPLCEQWRVDNPRVGMGRGGVVGERKIDQHGTVEKYKRGLCRCDECRAANREYKASLPRRDGARNEPPSRLD